VRDRIPTTLKSVTHKIFTALFRHTVINIRFLSLDEPSVIIVELLDQSGSEPFLGCETFLLTIYVRDTQN
jgi:hypothetical protein